MRVYGRCPANALTKKMRATPRKSTPLFFCVRSPLDGRSTDATFFTQCPENRVNRRFQGAKEPLGASRKSQQQTKRTGFAALEDSIADGAANGKGVRRANEALERANFASKPGFSAPIGEDGACVARARRARHPLRKPGK